MRVLFNALDFSTGYGEHNIPLQKRGDGIQSRHIPYILDFIARHTNTHHIWAYEEPETSLEIGSAFDLAKQFKGEFCEENQIFLTTHSPAFYDLSGEHVSKWYVYQQEYTTGNETQIENISSEELLDRKLGVAALVATRAREAYEKIQQLTTTVNRLDEQLGHHAIPHVIVEGITDITIMEAAYSKLYPDFEPFCEFLHAGGAANIPPYLKSAKVVSKEFAHAIIGLFDRDQEGRKQIRTFSHCNPVDNTEFYAISSERMLFAGLLSLPESLQTIESDIQNQIGNDLNLPVPIEYMFPSDIINEALNEGVIELEDRIAKASDPELPTPINLSEIYSRQLPDGREYLAKKVKKSTKTKFSQWVAQKPADSFENFRVVFDQLELVIATKQ